MSILSQLGIVVLIIFITGVLFFANKRVDKEAKKEETFPEGWEEYKKRKETLPEKPLSETLVEPETPAEEMPMEEPQEEPAEEIPAEEPVVIIPEKTVEKPTTTQPFLTLVHLDEKHAPVEEIKVQELPFTIGRARENSLVLEDLYVARQHCKIVNKDGQILLKDLGTANKITARGRSVEECVLEDGVRFYIGNEEFLVKKD